VIVLDYGYPSAWLVGSVIAVVLAIPLVFLRGRGKNPSVLTNGSGATNHVVTEIDHEQYRALER
jgi:hypothetical protein